MSKTKETLLRLLNNLLAPRIAALEKNEKAMTQELIYSEKLFDEISNTSKNNFFRYGIKNHSDIDLLKTPSHLNLKEKSKHESTKSISRPLRSKTPVHSGKTVRNTSNNNRNRQEANTIFIKKNLENSNLITQRNISRNNNNINTNNTITKSFASSKFIEL